MKRNLLILFIAALFLAACAPAASILRTDQSTATEGGAANSKGAESPMLAAPQAPSPVDPVAAYNAQTSASTPAQDRIVIQNADLTVVVKDPRAKMAEIAALARRLGGFVVSSNMSQINLQENVKVPEGNISIRVPAKDLDTALDEIKAGTVDVPNDNRSGQDVTDKYVDLQSQLKAKQAAADKLYEIMQTTQKADETLQVFNQLTQVQTEIEVLKGQIKYYEQAAALSVISVRLVAEETIRPIVIAGWQPQGVARDAVQALIDFFQNFASFLIWLVIYIIPVAAVVIVLLALLWRLVRWFWVKVFPHRAPRPAKEE